MTVYGVILSVFNTSSFLEHKLYKTLWKAAMGWESKTPSKTPLEQMSLHFLSPKYLADLRKILQRYRKILPSDFSLMEGIINVSQRETVK